MPFLAPQRVNRWTLLPSSGFFIVTYSEPLRKAAKGPGYIVRGVPGRATTTHRPGGAWEPIGAECWRRDGQRRAQTAAMPSGIQIMRGGIAPAERPGGVLLHKRPGAMAFILCGGLCRVRGSVGKAAI